MTAATPQLASLDDKELVCRVRAGCDDAFAVLVQRYEGRLFNFILRRVSDTADAEDVVQHAFLKCWQAIDRYDPRWQFSTWLFTIAMRVATNTVQQNARRRTTARIAAIEFRPSPQDPARHCEVSESRENIWAVVDRVLDEEPRLALWLHYAEDLPPRAIARVLGRTSVAVRVMLHRARRRLAEHADDALSASAGAGTNALGSRLSAIGSRQTDSLTAITCTKGASP